jgi:hypothetical protein
MYKNEKIEAIYFGIHDKLSNDTFFPRKWNCTYCSFGDVDQ